MWTVSTTCVHVSLILCGVEESMGLIGHHYLLELVLQVAYHFM